MANPINIVISAKDEASRVLRGVSSELGETTSRADNLGTSFGTRLKAGAVLASQAIAALSVATGAAGTFAVKAAAEYEQSLNIFRSVSDATSAEMAQVAATARLLGKDMTLPGVSASDAALAMVELAKAGLSVNDTLAASKGVLSLAKAGQLDTAQAASIAANALNAFSLKGDEATRVADLLAAAANASSADVGQLGYGLQMSAASAAQMKVPVEDLVTALASMANNGIAGSDAGTSLKTMFAALTPTTKSAVAAMKELGVDAFDSKGNFVGLTQVIAQLEKGTSKMTQEQKAMALETAFGSDAVRSASILTKEGAAGFDQLSQAVNRQGAAATLAAAQNSGFKGALDCFKSTVETIAIDLGTKLLPPLTSFLTLLTSQLEPAVGRVIAAIHHFGSEALEYLTPNLIALRNTLTQDVMPAARELLEHVIKPLAIAFGGTLVVALGLAIDALNFILSAASGVINELKAGNPIVWLLAGAFTGLATAMAFNAAFNALNVGFATLRLVTIPSVMASVGALQAMLLAPIVMPAIAVGAALASIALVYQKGKETLDLLDRMNEGARKSQDSATAAEQEVRTSYKEGRITKEAHDSFFRKIAGARAMGGPVSAGKPYLVGEEGPELVVPRQGGTVIPTGQTAQMMGGGAVTNVLSGTFNFSTSEAVDNFFNRLDKTQRLARMGMA